MIVHDCRIEGDDAKDGGGGCWPLRPPRPPTNADGVGSQRIDDGVALGGDGGGFGAFDDGGGRDGGLTSGWRQDSCSIVAGDGAAESVDVAVIVVAGGGGVAVVDGAFCC